MLTLRLHEAQIRLQSHRNWLTSFVLRSQLHPQSQATNRTLSSVNHQLPYPVHQISPRRNVRRSSKGGSSKATKVIRRAQDNAEFAEDNNTIQQIRKAIEQQSIREVTALYHRVSHKTLFGKHDFRNIAKLLHHSLRQEKRIEDAKKRREELEALLAFGEVLVGDVMKGDLYPNKAAQVHLIGLFKESGFRDTGINFWRWLEQQEDHYLSEDVYGAAIELLAFNGAPLADMEDLYQQALNRFPGSFSAYHLSPEAIVPDRDQATTLKGVPMTLLQGILTARLLRGDTRNAYLALDTALRLYPDQVPARFFYLFFEERPLPEAYAVFAIACRSGLVLPSSHFRVIMGMLRSASELSSPMQHALVVRAMLSISYMYIGAGGQIPENNVSEIIIATTQFLRLDGVSNLDAKQRQRLVSTIMEVIRKMIAFFARHGTTPTISAFNSIIANLAGFGQSKGIISLALSDARSIGLLPNVVTRRSVLTAAGTLHDGDLMKESWNDLVQTRLAAEQTPDTTDFFILVKTARAAGQVEFAKDELEIWKEKLPETDHERLSIALDEYEAIEPLSNPTSTQELSSFEGELQRILADLGELNGRSQGRPHVQNFSDQDLPMTLFPISSKASLSEPELRKLYDDLTTEPGQPQATQAAGGSSLAKSQSNTEASTTDESGAAIVAPALSATSIPFGELRYEHWKSINHLLEQSESNDSIYHRLVNKAIAEGVAPPQRNAGPTFSGDHITKSYGISDLANNEPQAQFENGKPDAAQIDAGRKEVLRLRGRIQ